MLRGAVAALIQPDKCGEAFQVPFPQTPPPGNPLPLGTLCCLAPAESGNLIADISLFTLTTRKHKAKYAAQRQALCVHVLMCPKPFLPITSYFPCPRLPLSY